MADAIEEVLNHWMKSEDGVVTKRAIDAIAEKHEVDQRLLGFAWQNFLREVVLSGSRRKAT